jgi:hypothetical protein
MNSQTIQSSVALDRRGDVVEMWRQAVAGDPAACAALFSRIMPLRTLDIPPTTIKIRPVDLRRQPESVSS